LGKGRDFFVWVGDFGGKNGGDGDVLSGIDEYSGQNGQKKRAAKDGRH
jgi:hypothetical protein